MSIPFQPIDPSVLVRISRGELTAVKDCISQHGRLVWSIARRLTRTAADAEDATQEIFLSIWRHAASYDPAKGSETSFIAVIARRRLVDRLRKVNSEVVIDYSVDVDETIAWADAGISPLVQLDAEVAIRALQQLRPEWRRVLELALMHGLTQTEISARLGMPLGTVKTHMSRSLLKLRQFMNVGLDPPVRKAASGKSGSQIRALAATVKFKGTVGPRRRRSLVPTV